MSNHPCFPRDWEILANLPFKRDKRTGKTFKRLYGHIETSSEHPDHKHLWLVKELLLVPYSLWRVPYDGLAVHVCNLIEAGERFSPALLLLLELLDDLPSQQEREAIIKVERWIEKGNYNELVPGTPKHDAREKRLLKDQGYQHFWNRIKGIFDVDKHRDPYGILRRTPTGERNYRKVWEFLFGSDKEQLQMIVDALAGKYVLFGIEGEKPLLQKLTLNPTAIGWLLGLPRYWLLDHRDVSWWLVNEFQTARGAQRDGVKRFEGQTERREQYKAAYRAKLAAADAGLRGQKRTDHIIAAANLSPDIDAGSLRRILREGEKFWHEDNKPGFTTGSAASDTEPGTLNVESVSAARKIEPGQAEPSAAEPAAVSNELSNALSVFDKLTPEEKTMFMKLRAA